VIICAGTVDSSKILQLSGIGDKNLLDKMRIKIIHHNPEVGQNLQNHLGFIVKFKTIDNKAYDCLLPTCFNPELGTIIQENIK